MSCDTWPSARSNRSIAQHATSPPASPAMMWTARSCLRPSDLCGRIAPPYLGGRKTYTSCDQKLGIEECGPGCATDHVVAERDKLVTKDRARAHAPDMYGHPTSVMHIQTRLRTILRGVQHDGPRRGGRKFS